VYVCVCVCVCVLPEENSTERADFSLEAQEEKKKTDWSKKQILSKKDNIKLSSWNTFGKKSKSI